ncbi:hypothetical protein BC739_003135 [Kutzneria viridogrisea]|uniref:Uncharacterized protein n=1 Tax=Kutzneria viridogrisea TaxID=47990 RepID=A0ABR6BGC7_9PSEU|nr:hypothetical protein [Kutzneria viridogrisea]
MQVLLGDASAVIRQHTRQAFTRAQTTERIRPIGDKAVLPQHPVISVDSVAVVDPLQANNLLPIPLAAWLWDGGQELWLGQMGTVINLPEDTLDLFQFATPLLQVTYTHGWDTIPDIVKAVTCSMVLRSLDLPGPGGIASQTVGPFGYRLSSVAQDGILALSTSEQAMLAPYRRQAVSVELR